MATLELLAVLPTSLPGKLGKHLPLGPGSYLLGQLQQEVVYRELTRQMTPTSESLQLPQVGPSQEDPEIPPLPHKEAGSQG